MGRHDRATVYAALGDEQRLAIIDALLLTDLTSKQVGDRVGIPSNLLAHHLSVLEAAGVVVRRRSDGDGRRRYISLMTQRLPSELVAPDRVAGRVLFTCRRNSARSQLAAALFSRRTGRSADSAGSHPAHVIHPRARAVAAEVGIELIGVPKGYREVTEPDVVVSVCDIAGEDQVPFPASHRLHWSIPDPVSDGRFGAFRRARTTLEARVERLAEAMG